MFIIYFKIKLSSKTKLNFLKIRVSFFIYFFVAFNYRHSLVRNKGIYLKFNFQYISVIFTVTVYLFESHWLIPRAFIFLNNLSCLPRLCDPTADKFIALDVIDTIFRLLTKLKFVPLNKILFKTFVSKKYLYLRYKTHSYCELCSFVFINCIISVRLIGTRYVQHWTI